MRMVKRVARAIAQNGFGRPWDDFEETNALDTDQSDLLDYARAAIEAMRDVTEEMKAAVDCAGEKWSWPSGQAWCAGYLAMMDAALAEPSADKGGAA